MQTRWRSRWYRKSCDGLHDLKGCYSIFQIDYLHLVLMEMTLQIQLDSYPDRNEKQSVDWQKNGERRMPYAGSRMEDLQTSCVPP